MEKIRGLTIQQFSYGRKTSKYDKLISITCGDYYKAGSTHIFFDPREINLPSVPELLDSIAKKPNQKVHIFISGSKGDVIPNLPAFIAFLMRYPETPTTIVVHVPKKVPFLYEMTDLVLKGIEPKLKYKLIRESRFVSFRTHWPVFLDVTFMDDEIVTNINLRRYEYPKTTKVNKDGKFASGPLCDPTMRDNIQMFKPQIVDGFKRSAPDGILKAFNNDEEIWDYIIQNGEWKLSEADDGSDDKK